MRKFNRKCIKTKAHCKVAIRELIGFCVYIKFAAEYCYKQPLMCAKNYQIWLRRFKDKGKNLRWSRFFGSRRTRSLIPCEHVNAIFFRISPRLILCH